MQREIGDHARNQIRGSLLRKAPTAEKGSEASATQAEIRAAIEGLSAPESLRLRKYAALKLFGHSWLSPEDLIGEAVLKTWTGHRKWKKSEVSFVGHLMGVIRSDAAHRTRKSSREKTSTAADLPRFEESEDPLEQYPASSPGPQREILAKEAVEGIEMAFIKDEEVTSVLAGLAEGMKGPEIRAEFGMREKQFGAALKRLHRQVNRVVRKERP